MEYFVIILCLGFVSGGIGGPVGEIDDDESRVLNGRLASFGEYPFLASVQQIYYNDSRVWKFCSAAILGPSYVLTAAHCFDKINPLIHDVRVRAGVLHAYEKNNTAQFISVAKAYKHPNYVTKGSWYDIAVLKLDEPFQLGFNVQPISLPPRGFDPLPYGDIVGWGRTDVRQKNISFELRVAKDVPVSDPLPCSLLLPQNFNRTTMLCVGVDHPSNACHGDSGGPFVQRDKIGGKPYVTGVTSFGFDECDSRPVVYTKVEPALDFIHDCFNGKYDKTTIFEHVLIFLTKINPFSVDALEGIDPLDYYTNFST